MRTKPVKAIREKERGMVPSRAFGIKDVAYGEYLKTLDPENRTDVQAALAASPDVRFVAFYERLGQKRFGRKISLQAIAKGCGIPLAEFNTWWQKASTQRAIAIAQTSAVDVTSDMAIDARSTQEYCDRCDGLGFLNADEGLPMETPGYRILRMVERKTTNADGEVTGTEEVPVYIRHCPRCRGTREVREPGDEFSREKLLEMAGHINRRGPGIQITQNFGGAGMASAVPRLNDAMTIDVDAAE